MESSSQIFSTAISWKDRQLAEGAKEAVQSTTPGYTVHLEGAPYAGLQKGLQARIKSRKVDPIHPTKNNGMPYRANAPQAPQIMEGDEIEGPAGKAFVKDYPNDAQWAIVRFKAYLSEADNPHSSLWKPNNISFLNEAQYDKYVDLLNRLRMLMAEQKEYLKQDFSAAKTEKEMEAREKELRLHLSNINKMQEEIQAFIEEVGEAPHVVRFFLRPLPGVFQVFDELKELYEASYVKYFNLLGGFYRK